MLDISAKKGVRPWIQKRPLKEANQAVLDMSANKARYRYVLVNEGHVQESQANGAQINGVHTNGVQTNGA